MEREQNTMRTRIIPLLPCQNAPEVVQQIKPTMDLLIELDSRHPQILRDVGVDPENYHQGMVFRSAIESIRGQQASRQTAPREAFVLGVLAKMQESGRLDNYAQTPTGVRWDFMVQLETSPVRRVQLR